MMVLQMFFIFNFIVSGGRKNEQSSAIRPVTVGVEGEKTFLKTVVRESSAIAFSPGVASLKFGLYTPVRRAENDSKKTTTMFGFFASKRSGNNFLSESYTRSRKLT